jgi:hypothetical protein
MKRKGEKVGEEGDLKDSRAWASEKRHKSLGTSSVKKKIDVVSRFATCTSAIVQKILFSNIERKREKG